VSTRSQGHRSRREGQELTPPKATGFLFPAVGVTATVDGAEIRVGGPRLLEDVGAREVDTADAWRSEGAIILHVTGTESHRRAQARRRDPPRVP
jgi:cation transport ATPase